MAFEDDLMEFEKTIKDNKKAMTIWPVIKARLENLEHAEEKAMEVILPIKQALQSLKQNF